MFRLVTHNFVIMGLVVFTTPAHSSDKVKEEVVEKEKIEKVAGQKPEKAAGQKPEKVAGQKSEKVAGQKPIKVRDEFLHVLASDTEYYTTSPAQTRPPDGTFKAGTKVALVEKAGSYVLVRTESGVEGYVAVENLKRPAKEPKEKLKELVGDHVNVVVRGTLKTGIVAIGGETTGTVISADNITWELDFGEHEKLRKMAEEMDGRTVVVAGILQLKQGVEIPQRWIVAVSSLKPGPTK